MHSVQRLTTTLPVRKDRPEQPKERGPMMEKSAVAQFVHDHVLDARSACLDQLRVQCDRTVGRAASPSPTHGAHPNLHLLVAK